MEKPITIKREEFGQAVAEIINSSGLPAFAMAEILQGMIGPLRKLEAQQAREDRMLWEQAQEKEKASEKDKKNERQNHSGADRACRSDFCEPGLLDMDQQQEQKKEQRKQAFNRHRLQQDYPAV